MKRDSVLVAVVALSSVALAAPVAQAVPARDLYMVKDVQQTSGVYIGEFAALEKTGRKVVGAIGAFNSEYLCVAGKVKKGKLHGTYYQYGRVFRSFTRKWRGTGGNQRIKGMTPVNSASMFEYLGSDPDTLVQGCIRSIGLD